MLDIKKNILSALAYFDLFNYPLTTDEIFLYLPAKCDIKEFDHTLKCMVADRHVYHFEKFYTLKNDYFVVSRRIKGNIKAAELVNMAKRVSDLLVKLPFVRGIAISGSLSKNFADEHSDIDLFIITAKNKLWIARTLINCFKRVMSLVNREHQFCMNYFIDEQDLQIQEKNIYTAIEIATLIPLHGDVVFEKFYTENSWSRNFLPNKFLRLATAKSVKRGLLKRMAEMLLDNRLGNVLDTALMSATANHWMKKKRLSHKGAGARLDTGKHFAKPNSQNFQDKLILNYKNKLSSLFENWENNMANTNI